MSERLFIGQGAIIPIPVEYLRRLGGDYVAAALLSQIVYWHEWAKKNGKDDGFYKTYSDWMEDLVIGSENTISRAKCKLESLGIVEVKIKKDTLGTPKNHWKINEKIYDEWCGVDSTLQEVQSGLCRKCRDDFAESADTSITKITNKDNAKKINYPESIDEIINAIQNSSNSRYQKNITESCARGMAVDILEYYGREDGWRFKDGSKVKNWRSCVGLWLKKAYADGKVSFQSNIVFEDLNKKLSGTDYGF